MQVELEHCIKQASKLLEHAGFVISEMSFRAKPDRIYSIPCRVFYTITTLPMPSLCCAVAGLFYSILFTW